MARSRESGRLFNFQLRASKSHKTPFGSWDDKILVDFGITGLPDAEIDALNRVWHRLRPWPDSVSGLTRLQKRFIIAPLSNGTFP